MTEETLAAPVAEAQNNATEPTNELSEVVTEETTAEPEQESPEDANAKAIKRMERRINKKHAEAAEARAERDFLKQRLEQLEAKPDADAEPDLDSIVEKRVAALAEQQKVQSSVDSVLKQGKALPGFTEACNTVHEELPFYRDGKPTLFLQAVLDSDAPAKLLHHLGTNPDLLEELAELPQTKQIRRLDRIEREMATPKTSTAPKPLTPVKATASESGLASAKSDKEWADMRDKELRERGRTR